MKTEIAWAASCQAAKDVFNILMPYLSPIKKQQYRQVSKELVSVESRKKGWIYDKN